MYKGEFGIAINAEAYVAVPGITAASFSANDFVGAPFQLTGVQTGELESLAVVDAAKQKAALSLLIFNAEPAGVYADNAAEGISLADMQKCIGKILIAGADYTDYANASVAIKAGIAQVLKGDLWAVLITTGTPTYTKDCLQLTFVVKHAAKSAKGIAT